MTHGEVDSPDGERTEVRTPGSPSLPTTEGTKPTVRSPAQQHTPHLAPDELSTADVPSLLGGRYRIEAMLGAGGMGSVYRVRDLELDDVVALKIVGTLEGSALIRFRDEVKLARRVTHPNVARTFDIGEHQGVRFLTMEYVAGESLRRHLGRTKLTEISARGLAAGICDGIAAIHDADVVHGDLKPENIVVTEAETPKVSDFGLAMLRDDGSRRRRSGTPPYMAPEQHHGSPATQRSDLFALGMILHELFAGKRPGDAGRGQPHALSTLLPRDVAAIVARCLDHEPDRRPRDAREVCKSLDGPSAHSERFPRAGTSLTRPDRDAVTIAVNCLHVDDARDAYLGAALSGDIARALSTVRALAIRARPVGSTGEIDDVDATIEGNVRRIGSRVQLALRLVSRRDGYLLWGRTITVELVDMLAAVEEMIAAIANALGARATRRTQSALRDPQLIELYLRARDLDYATWHAHDSDNADLYKRILDQQPDDPLILACYSRALTRRAIRQEGALATAQAAAERALALAPELADAHLAVGIRLFIGNDGEGAIRAMVRGLELAPSSAFGHSILGYAMCECGLVERGLTELEFALSLEHDLPMAWANSVRYHDVLGHATRVDELLSSPPPVRALDTEWVYWMTRTRVAILRGESHARALADELESSPHGSTGLLRPMLPALRRTQTAAELRLACTPLFLGDHSNHRVRALGLGYIAEVALYLGDVGSARDALVGCVEEGTLDIAWLDAYHPFQTFHDEPWFRACRQRVAERAERVRDALGEATGATS